MKKFLYAALIVFALGFISRGAASADEALADSMAPGTWAANPRYITFGEYNGHALKWRVLEVRGDKTAFLVLDDVLRKPASEGGGAVTMAFDDDDDDGQYDNGVDTNSFPDSTIKIWLNGAFLGTAFTANEQDAILETNYGPDNARLADQYTWTEGKSKVFLSSVGEATNNADLAMPDDYEIMNCWLRSPSINVDHAASMSFVGGVVYYGLYVITNRFAVRPALKINLASPAFTSAFVSYPPERE